MNQPKLQELFNFNDADLSANRNGQVSEKQQAQIASNEKSSQGFGRGFGIILCIVAVIPIVILWVSGAFAFFGWASLLWGIWPLIWGGLGLALIKGSFDAYTYVLKQVQGPANIVKAEWRSGGRHSSTHVDYELHIGEIEFEVDPSLADYVMQGDVYSVYYIEDSDGEHKPISMEALSR
jgi:hypothetical protein